MQTIYKEVTNVRWNAGVTLQHPVSGSYSNKVDLSNYYTKTQLGTAGQSVVDFENISNAYHNHLLGLEGGESMSDESSGSAGEYYHLDYASYTWVLARGGGDLWLEDSIGDLYTVTAGAGVYIDGILIKNNIIDAQDGDLRHLTISAGDVLETLQTGGDLILKAGNSIASDSNTTPGSVYIVPGSAVDNANSSSIYLGDDSLLCESIGIWVKGIETNIDLTIEQKGSAAIRIGNAYGSLIRFHGYIFEFSTNLIRVGNYYDNQDTIEIIPIQDFSAYGKSIKIQGGTSYGSPDDYDGGNVTITGGISVGTGHTGGDVYIYGGQADSAGVDGNIYFGDGSNGYLPAADSSITQVVMYDTSTGKLFYGDGGNGGDILWQADSIGDLSTVTAGAGVTIGDINIKNFTIQSTTPGYDIGIQAANAIEGEMMNGEGWGGNVYISSGAGAGSNGTGGSVYIFLGQGDGNNGNLFIADLPIADSADIQYVLTYDPYSKIVRYTQLI